jgi:hypothetical protein
MKKDGFVGALIKKWIEVKPYRRANMKRINTFKITLVLSIIMSLFIVQSSWSVEGHQAWQPRPIKLGTSGGNIYDSSRVYYCGRTLGFLVQDANNVQYILSNNHVPARTNLGIIGGDIIQPRLIDRNAVCYRDYNDAVAYLSGFMRISFKRVYFYYYMKGGYTNA